MSSRHGYGLLGDVHHSWRDRWPIPPDFASSQLCPETALPCRLFGPPSVFLPLGQFPLVQIHWQLVVRWLAVLAAVRVPPPLPVLASVSVVPVLALQPLPSPLLLLLVLGGEPSTASP